MVPRGLWVVVAAAACGGAAHQGRIGPPPPPETRAVLAGGLCQDNRCACRENRDEGPGGAAEGPDRSGPDGGVGVPERDDRKRFEFRLGPSPYELWLTVDGSTVLYKSPERPVVCYYVDLSTGTHPVELRASNPGGVSAAFTIQELGTRTKSWYDTFTFSCGSPGACSLEELEEERARVAAASRQLFDKCGTTKAMGVAWDHSAVADQLHPSELIVRLTLDIYRFAAWKQHGDPTCGTGRPPDFRDADGEPRRPGKPAGAD